MALDANPAIASYDAPVLVHCGSANRVGALFALSEYGKSKDLEKARFEPCGPFTERSSGWVRLDMDTSDSLARRVNGADLFRLRSQSRVLPGTPPRVRSRGRVPRSITKGVFHPPRGRFPRSVRQRARPVCFSNAARRPSPAASQF